MKTNDWSTKCPTVADFETDEVLQTTSPQIVDFLSSSKRNTLPLNRKIVELVLISSEALNVLNVCSLPPSIRPTAISCPFESGLDYRSYTRSGLLERTLSSRCKPRQLRKWRTRTPSHGSLQTQTHSSHSIIHQESNSTSNTAPVPGLWAMRHITNMDHRTTGISYEVGTAEINTLFDKLGQYKWKIQRKWRPNLSLST